jgi:hypothetical protein
VDDIGIHYTWLGQVSVMSTATAWYALFRNMGCVLVLLLFFKKMFWRWLARLAGTRQARGKDRGVGEAAFACPTSHLRSTSLPFFPSHFTPPITSVSGPPAKGSRITGLQLPAKMPR